MTRTRFSQTRAVQETRKNQKLTILLLERLPIIRRFMQRLDRHLLSRRLVAKKEKVVKPKKPKKAPKKVVKENDFYNKLFEVFPLSLPASPPFSDGQIDEFQCQHCGIHKELDDETWYACPYAIFHGLIKSGSDQLGDQSSVFLHN